MKHYIDKSALVAEIKRRISQLESEYKKLSNLEIWITAKEIEHKINGLKEALSIINALEVKKIDTEHSVYKVKEVNLEKEIKEEYLNRRCYVGKDNMLVILNEPQFNEVAKQFFELGLKAQKGE